jgi:hypothetical protein
MTYTNKHLRKDFLVALLFYRDKQGTLCLEETVNDGDVSDSASMYKIGMDLTKDKLLDEADKKAFASLCRGFLKNLEEAQRQRADSTKKGEK